VTLVIAGCASTPPFGSHGYIHPGGQYRIVAQTPTVLGRDWILDSHSGSSTDELEPKTGPDYEVTYKFDADGDGEDDVEYDLPLYDAYWTHQVDSSSIWIRTIPIPDRLSQKDAKVLLMNYIERIAGSGLTFANYEGDVTARVNRYGTKIASSSRVMLGETPASAAEIEIVNLDQLELDPSAPRHHAKLVLAHSLKWLPVGERLQYNSVLLVGYSARTEDFPKHKAEFDSLISMVELEQVVVAE
jgi:hypothetical protein